MRLVVVVLVIAGCDRAFGLEAVPDARLGIAQGPHYIAPGDYDGDGEPDAEDPCPLVPHEDLTDDDGDGLPNVCDPDLVPGEPDCIVLFDHFDAARSPSSIDPRWTANPSWQLDTCNGDVGLCSPIELGTATLYFAMPLAAARVEASLRTATADTSATSVQLMSDFSLATGVSGRACGLVHADTESVQLAVRDLVDAAPTDSFEDPALFSVPSTDAVQLRWTPPGDCRFSPPAHAVIAPTPAQAQATTIGLHVVDARVSLRYVLAYGARCR